MTTGSTVSVSSLLDTPAPPSLTMRRRTATATGNAPTLTIVDSDPAGPLGHHLQTRCNPAASPTAATGSACRPDPFPCRLAGRHGASTVRPLPRRAYRNFSFTPQVFSWWPTAHTWSDALGDAAKLQFDDSVARYSHADGRRENHAEPTCHAMMRYISIGRSSVLPLNVWHSTPLKSVHPSQTCMRWRARVDYMQPTTTSSY